MICSLTSRPLKYQNESISNPIRKCLRRHRLVVTENGISVTSSLNFQYAKKNYIRYRHNFFIFVIRLFFVIFRLSLTKTKRKTARWLRRFQARYPPIDVYRAPPNRIVNKQNGRYLFSLD